MFLIFIDELVWLLDKYGVKVKLFADDMKLYLRILNDVDILVLQDALTAVYNWANEWQLSISIEKCYILSLGKATNQVVLSIGNSVLPKTVSLSVRHIAYFSVHFCILCK